MAKRKYRMTIQKYKRYLKQGRGRGQGKSYRAWLTIHDFSSRGNSHRLFSWKTQRIIHLFSDLELALFYLLEINQAVWDICEQFPLLPPAEIMRIVRECSSAWYERLGKLESEHNFIYVPTSDFRVSVHGRTGKHDLVFTVKPAAHLTPHQQLKFEVEKRYWHKRGVTVGIVTDEKLRENDQLFRNIRFLRPFRSLDNYPLNQCLDPTQRHEIMEELTNRLLGRKARLRDVARMCDDDFAVQSGTALLLANHLVANGWWHMDMTKPYNPAGDTHLLSANLSSFALTPNQTIDPASQPIIF
jgi:hypothetical protein